ncbi:hypothetical protein [Stenotrophomonas sp. ATCM1_4]|uniref:hypothetical protein n=1 Tax=Stenotrophomonas sp. ATCM1_4 TaxID=2259330 RepID=UPI001A9F8C08|nr:hypothetical protein [Stenotrophomonas sp. ATCM1_4]
MQCMISHESPLPRCALGHQANHIHDKRRAISGGGHNIECKCSHTGRHEQFEDALSEWCRMQGVALPAAETARAPVVPLPEARQAREVPVDRGTITSLNAMQREAMRRALAGDFELADAMELLSKGRMRGGAMVNGRWHEYDLQFGIWIGGRLQAFAYGSEFDQDDDDSYIDTRLVLDLNGDTLFSAAPDDDYPDVPSQYLNGRTPVWAQTVVDSYNERLAAPQQQTFFSSEEAA